MHRRSAWLGLRRQWLEAWQPQAGAPVESALILEDAIARGKKLPRAMWRGGIAAPACAVALVSAPLVDARHTHVPVSSSLAACWHRSQDLVISPLYLPWLTRALCEYAPQQGVPLAGVPLWATP